MHIACGPPSLQCGGEEGRIPGACTHMSAILSRGQRGSAECRAGVAQRCASPTTLNGSTYLKPQPNSGALYLYLFQDFYVQLSKVVKPHTRRGPPLTDVDMLGGWGQWPPSSFPSFFSAGSHSHAKGTCLPCLPAGLRPCKAGCPSKVRAPDCTSHVPEHGPGAATPAGRAPPSGCRPARTQGGCVQAGE